MESYHHENLKKYWRTCSQNFNEQDLKRSKKSFLSNLNLQSKVFCLAVTRKILSLKLFASQPCTRILDQINRAYVKDQNNKNQNYSDEENVKEKVEDAEEKHPGFSIKVNLRPMKKINAKFVRTAWKYGTTIIKDQISRNLLLFGLHKESSHATDFTPKQPRNSHVTCHYLN